MNPLWDMLVSAREESPDSPALHTENRTYSFDELHGVAKNVARTLREEGLRSGDVVATLLPNAMDWIVTLAAAHEGLLSVSLHHGGQAGEVGAALLIAVPERLTVAPDSDIPVKTVSEKWFRQHEGNSDTTPARNYDGPDSLVRLVLTSGTTGNAKAAEYTAGTVRALADSAAEVLGHGGDLRLSLMGFSTMGGVYQALAHLSVRTPFVAINAINDRIPGLIDELEITVLVAATVSLAQLCDAYDLRSDVTPRLGRVIIAGSTASDALLQRLAATFPEAELSIMYGSTEGGLIAAKKASVGADPRIVGYVMSNVQLEVVDEHGTPVPRGETGEIRYRSTELIERYYRDPVSTAAAIREGWFYPGDRGVFLETGELMIAGRVDDVINLGGIKVDPVTLETIAQSVPGVNEAAAYLVHDDKGLASIELAVVAESPETLKLVDQRLREDPLQVIPRNYRRVAKLPRNQMGKLVRHELESIDDKVDL